MQKRHSKPSMEKHGPDFSLSRLVRPERVRREEMIDSHDHSDTDFFECFRDIRNVNRFLGGTSVVRSRIQPFLMPTTTLLDVGTGLADIPQALIRWGQQIGVCFRVTGLDANEKILRLANHETSGIALVHGLADHLPFRDSSFDIVVSSLTFHHFEEGYAASAIKEMHRVARRAVIVNDLRRGYLPAALIWIVTRLARMHPLTKNDAPLSVMRAFSMDEYRGLAHAAGFPGATVYSHPFWRAAIVLRKDP